jgi:hypothetical protein
MASIPPCVGYQNFLQNRNRSPPKRNPSTVPKRVESLKTAVITDPKTGKNLSLEELATSSVEEQLKTREVDNNSVIIVFNIISFD